jgi:hypothetical protein
LVANYSANRFCEKKVEKLQFKDSTIDNTW